MMEELKQYNEYRNSGLPWADKMPAHWELVPNRAIMRKRKMLVGERHHEYKLLSLTKAGVVIRDVDSGKGKFSADMGTSQEVRAGDLVFCLFDVPETPRTVGLSPHDGMITGAYTVFECGDELARRFIARFYESMDDGKLLSPLYSGLRNTIPPPRFLGVKTPLPPRDEQAAIVKYLDHIDRRINRYIRAKKKVVVSLEEEKQSIIQAAVTRGVCSSVKLKPSGVDWIGPIPIHWNVTRIKYLLREIDTRSVNGTEILLSMRMQHGLVPFAEHFDRPHQAKTLVGFKVVHPGDFVLNRMQAGNGLIFSSALHGLVSPDYGVFKPIGDVDVEYLGLLFRSRKVKAKFRSESKGLGTGTSGFLRLYTDRFGALHVALPPTDEQKDIVSWVKAATAKYESSIRRVMDEERLAREYRSRLVADVVTGKVDVRAAAAKLPDITDEEPANEIDETDADLEDADVTEEEAA